jgi:hypothetical protein
MSRSDAKMLLKKLLPFGLTAILLFTLVLSGCRSGIGNSGGNGGGGNGGGGNGDDGLASEVYVAGFYIDEDGAEIACYWDVNGERYDIDENFEINWLSGSRVTQIVVDNSNNVYISGTNSSGAACYWVWDSKEEKATEHQLDGLEANSIFVSNNQVYIGGLYEDHGKALPCYWDSTGWRYDLDLPDNAEGNVGSIFVYNDKVYAAGSYIDAEGGYACYWDPMGIRHDLDVDGSKSSWIKSILVR